MTAVTNDLIRLNVNLNKPTAELLRQIVDRHGSNFAETVRKAIIVYNYIDEETRAGRRVITMDSDGSNQAEVVLL